MRPAKQQLSCSRLLRSALNIEHSNNSAASHLPLFLCPAAARSSATLSQSGASRVAALSAQRRPLLPLNQSCRLHAEAKEAKEADQAKENSKTKQINEAEPSQDVTPKTSPVRRLPVQCHGCGALSQTSVPNEPGYYDLNRKAVKTYLGLLNEEPRGRKRQDDIVQTSLRSLSKEKLKELGVDPASLNSSNEKPQQQQQQQQQRAQTIDVEPVATGTQIPLCDRCHNLVYNHTGEPIYHPTIEAIRDTIDESPHKYNHVYHVLDAADFPMSILPKVHQLLELMPLRSKNRRQRGAKFYSGKRTELSFIITRSDLLAPKKEAVDRMMPYLTEVLRQALPRDSRHVRLGNVRCVSAKRSWWTQELKEDIWKRGGAGWMVGKVNVGKSQLFEAVYPKGRMDWKTPRNDVSVGVVARKPYPLPLSQSPPQNTPESPDSVLPDLGELHEGSLLPPAQLETNYPQMPVVSALPGTTASPIRVPFGRGRGELIDLPGLERSELDAFVREEHRPSLIMKARMTPEQQVIKPGQSLLIGGFIRITPRTPDLIFLAYAFTPIEPHLTATEKAIEIQNQEGEVKVANIAVPGIAKTIKHAGAFKVQYDVTKKRAGPITNKNAAGIKVDRLPYRVLSMDLLIEGCGWVEITVQVRTKDLLRPTPAMQSINVGGTEILQSLDLSDPEFEEGLKATDAERENHPLQESDSTREPNWPVVDVYSPEGRFIGSRQPMNAWLYNKVRKTAQTSKKRPRKSMTGAKKKEKQDRRRESDA